MQIARQNGKAPESFETIPVLFFWSTVIHNSNNIAKHGIKAEYKYEDLAQVNPQLRVSLAIVNARPSSTDSISDSEEKSNTLHKENSSGMRYSKDTDNKEILRIKDQINAHQDELNAMEVVAFITSNGRNGRSNAQLQKDIIESMRRKGTVIDVGGFGKIQIDERRVKLALEYCTTDAEIAVFDTIHRVLKRGIRREEHANHKNEGFETVTFMAPVELNGKRGNVGVVVRNTKGWLYKAHRILMPDGTVFNLDLPKTKDESEMPTNGTHGNIAADTPFIISDSTNSISDSEKKSNASGQKIFPEVKKQKSADSIREEQYSYQALVSKPDMQVTRINDSTVYQSNKADRKSIVDRAIQTVKQIGGSNEYKGAFVYVPDIDTEVTVTRKSIEHSLDRRLNILGAVSENLGSILQNSIRINELDSRSGNIAEVIGCAINQDGKPYVHTVVNKYNNELSSMDVLYAVNAKKEPAALIAPRVTENPLSITDSTISISDLLDFVNRYFPDVLPESVLRHYGHTARPDGMFLDMEWKFMIIPIIKEAVLTHFP